MTSTSRVSASSAVSASTANGRLAAGSRATVVDRVEELNPTSFLGIADPWRRASGGSAADDFRQFSQQNQQWQQQQDAPQTSFTHLVKLNAAAYPASEANQEGKVPSSPTFITELSRGIGVYEVNMQICAGLFNNQGSVINRYS